MFFWQIFALCEKSVILCSPGFICTFLTSQATAVPYESGIIKVCEKQIHVQWLTLIQGQQCSSHIVGNFPIFPPPFKSHLFIYCEIQGSCHSACVMVRWHVVKICFSQVQRLNSDVWSSGVLSCMFAYWAMITFLILMALKVGQWL